MRVGIILPQGWTGEYAGLDPRAAWARTLEVAQAAEELGFESIWLFDHFHTTPEPTDEITFESLTALAALAALTRRVRLGQIVACSAYRNPALLAKMISTLDAISGGRVEVGLGAGWKRDEFEAYGYPFLALRDRLGVLRETLEVVGRMLAPGRATWAGEHASVSGAINMPKPIQQPRPPIMVGGNGREVTWRLAARHADELNLDATPPAELPDAMAVIADRCGEVGRDPATLRVSVHIWWEHLDAAPDRARLLEAYRRAGVARVMTLVRETARDPGALESFRDDALEAGADLEAGPDRSLDPPPAVATRL